MKKNIIASVLLCLFIAPVMADKPAWAGKGKPTAEQKQAHREAMEEKADLGDNEDAYKEKKDKSDKLKGVEKQQTKKSEQDKIELDKGSDKGKASREANSKKWWKFWAE